jgi:hypothetical protein
MGAQFVALIGREPELDHRVVANFIRNQGENGDTDQDQQKRDTSLGPALGACC